MTPMSLMILIGAPISGRLSDRIGARWLLFSGTAIMAIGILLIIRQVSITATAALTGPGADRDRDRYGDDLLAHDRRRHARCAAAGGR